MFRQEALQLDHGLQERPLLGEAWDLALPLENRTTRSRSLNFAVRMRRAKVGQTCVRVTTSQTHARQKGAGQSGILNSIFQNLPNFGGLVLGCIEADFCE